MICSYTQTYSDNRVELCEFHNKDSSDIRFRNKLDNNYFVFHNSSDTYMNTVCEFKYFQNIEKKTILSYNNISYTQSLYRTFQRMKDDGYKYVVFLQDDVFSTAGDGIIDKLVDYIRHNSFDMLNLEYSAINPAAPIIYSSGNLQIYNSTSEDFKLKKLWPFDDGPYVAGIDFIMNTLFDYTHLSKNDIWTAEFYIRDKVDRKPIQRLTTNYIIFKRFDIVGPNACNRDVTRSMLVHNLFECKLSTTIGS